MLPLLLPAPQFHECVFCGITSHYVPSLDVSHSPRRTLFFVEHGIDINARDSARWDLCDLCDALDIERFYNRTPEITVHRGSTDCSDQREYFGFDRMPMICVSTASHADREEHREHEHQTWLYCRTRAEWRAAWQIARILAKNGNRPDRFMHLLAYLPAYKRPGDFVTGHPEVLNGVRCAGGPLWGLCDGCGTEDLVIVEPGTQWANCELCHIQAKQRRAERGEA